MVVIISISVMAYIGKETGEWSSRNEKVATKISNKDNDEKKVARTVMRINMMT